MRIFRKKDDSIAEEIVVLEEISAKLSTHTIVLREMNFTMSSLVSVLSTWLKNLSEERIREAAEEKEIPKATEADLKF